MQTMASLGLSTAYFVISLADELAIQGLLDSLVHSLEQGFGATAADREGRLQFLKHVFTSGFTV